MDYDWDLTGFNDLSMNTSDYSDLMGSGMTFDTTFDSGYNVDFTNSDYNPYLYSGSTDVINTNLTDETTSKNNYYYQNRDAHIAYAKERYYQNREEKIEYQKKLHKKNPEKYKAYQAKWYQDNKEKRKQQLKRKITCECGAVISYSHKSKHKKTNLHAKRMRNKGN